MEEIDILKKELMKYLTLELEYTSKSLTGELDTAMSEEIFADVQNNIARIRKEFIELGSENEFYATKETYLLGIYSELKSKVTELEENLSKFTKEGDFDKQDKADLELCYTNMLICEIEGVLKTLGADEDINVIKEALGENAKVQELLAEYESLLKEDISCTTRMVELSFEPEKNSAAIKHLEKKLSLLSEQMDQIKLKLIMMGAQDEIDNVKNSLMPPENDFNQGYTGGL